jgi:hypothetical protein
VVAAVLTIVLVTLVWPVSLLLLGVTAAAWRGSDRDRTTLFWPGCDRSAAGSHGARGLCAPALAYDSLREKPAALQLRPQVEHFSATG